MLYVVIQKIHMENVLIYDINSERTSENNDEPSDLPANQKCEKETTVSEIMQSKIIKVRSHSSSPQEPQKKQQNHTEIIFYEEEEGGLGWEESNRGLLKRQVYENEEEEEYQEEERDQLCELEMKQKRVMVPEQKVMKDKTVLVRANSRILVHQLVPHGYKLTCYIRVERNMLGMPTKYMLFLGQQKQFLLAAKKQTLKYYSNFLISSHPAQIHKRIEEYMGRLEANFVGTQFKLYTQHQENQQLKLQLKYDFNLAGFQGPRSFEVTKINPKASNVCGRDLTSIMLSNQKSKLIKMTTAKPTIKKGKFVLDFEKKGKACAKNFILQSQEQNNLLFVKVKDDLFLSEISYPLTLFEGFAVCLASLDSKLLAN